MGSSTGYGYHPDEMYFVISGAHPAFGYPDQPALVPLLCWMMNHLAPQSLLVLRLPSAIAGAVTTVLAAMVAREAGGQHRAAVIAATCTDCSGFALAACHFVTTTTFDLLSTTALFLLLIRAMSRHSGRSLLWAGVVAGLGSEAKPQVAFVVLLALLALLVVGPRWPLRSWWLAAGIGVAVLLAAPYAIWQFAHGLPQLTVASNVAGSAEGGRIGFVPFQLVMVSPLLVPVWVAGLVALWRRVSLRALRFVPLTYLLLAGAYLIGDRKAYYPASMYPAVLGLGSLLVADWTRRHRARLRGALIGVGAALSVALNSLVALPLLPPTALQGSVVMALNPRPGTDGWLAAIHRHSCRRLAGAARSAARTDGDLHGELLRRGGGRRARQVPRAAPRVQRAQRLQSVGAAPGCGHLGVAARLRQRGRCGAVLPWVPTAGARQRRCRAGQRRAGRPGAAVPACGDLAVAVAAAAARRLIQVQPGPTNRGRTATYWPHVVARPAAAAAGSCHRRASRRGGVQHHWRGNDMGPLMVHSVWFSSSRSTSSFRPSCCTS